MTTGIIIVDHGSRSRQSNELLENLARQFAKKFQVKYRIVEPAHMEIAEPTIAQAFDRCVARGAQRVVVCPFFLAPGKHMTLDIPQLAADAAKAHPQVEYVVGAPLGVDELMLQLLQKRVDESLHGATVETLGRM